MMSTCRGWLLSGLCVMSYCMSIEGAYYIIPQARNFSECAVYSDCPNKSRCMKTGWGNFCVCDQDFYNYNEHMTVSCPEGQCQAKATCKDSPNLCYNDTFLCHCPAGKFKRVTQLNGKRTIVCSDQNILQCESDDSCPPNAQCTHKSCYCKKGFTSPKRVQILNPDEECQDIDECSVNNGNCPIASTCNNIIGSFSCVCQDGYILQTRGKNKTCIDIDECSVNNGNCPIASTCNNIIGSFSCVCQDGYILQTRGKNKTCIDLNECLLNNGYCPSNSFCNNTFGSFSCVCQDGYTLHMDGQNKTCIDIDECSINNGNCPKNSFCNNTIGSFSCVCQDGYTLNTTEKDNTCIDIDECSINNGNCPKNSFCNNTIGSFGCVCQDGYTLNTSEKDNICIDIDECSINNGNCSKNTFCNNTIGSFNCMCQDGYTLHNDGKNNACIDINECSINNGNCPRNSFCNNTIGSFICVCQDGYTLRTHGKNSTCIEQNGTSYPNECSKPGERSKQCLLLDQLDRILMFANVANDTELSVENVTNEISQVLNQSLKHVNESLDRSVVTSLLNTVEETMLTLFTQKPSNRKVSTPELEVSMRTSNGSCSNKSSFITLDLANNSMNVPCGLVPEEKDGAVFILYNDLQSSLTGALQNDPKTPKNQRSAAINSQVVTGAVTLENTTYLDPPVRFYLRHQKRSKPTDRLQCVFWDENVWSSRGCDTETVNSTHTLCSCSHLSSFAILTSFEEKKVDWIQTILTYIGLSVSLLCLALSFLTFILRRALRSAHTSVLLALIGCLFLAQLLFLVGIQQTTHRVVCSIIAGSLQFFFLCAFSWMSIESILLFLTVRNLQAMNYLTSRHSHFPVLCIVGFGIPVVIVTISAAVRPTEYGTSSNCWLTSNIIWSFLGPVLVHIMVNTTLLIITFYLLRKKLASLNASVSALKDKRLLVFKALAQVLLLGCTWILGYFQIGSATAVMAYVFILLNSLQGFFIFLVHCLLNRQVREEYKKLFLRIRPQKSELEALSNSTVPMTVKSSNTYETTKGEKSVISWSTNEVSSTI